VVRRYTEKQRQEAIACDRVKRRYSADAMPATRPEHVFFRSSFDHETLRRRRPSPRRFARSSRLHFCAFSFEIITLMPPIFSAHDTTAPRHYRADAAFRHTRALTRKISLMIDEIACRTHMRAIPQRSLPSDACR